MLPPYPNIQEAGYCQLCVASRSIGRGRERGGEAAFYFLKFYKSFMTVTFVFPWKVSPVPAVQDVSVLLARMVNGEAVPSSASSRTEKADCWT